VIDECFEVVDPLLGTAMACVATGRARATAYRRRRGPQATVRRPRPSPPNKLTEAALCMSGPVASVPALSLEPEFTRSHGSLYKALVDPKGARSSAPGA